MQKLDFTEKLIEKGKRESTDALLKKMKVGGLVWGSFSSVRSIRSLLIDASSEDVCAGARFDGHQIA